MRRYTLPAAAAVLALIPWQADVRATPPQYTVRDLGSYNGVVPTIAGINAAGQVVGTVNDSLAVRLVDGVTWEPVPGVGTTFSVATGINDSGDIVGYHFDSTNHMRAFRYNHVTNAIDDVAALAPTGMTLGYAINAAGDIVGYGTTPAGVVAFRATPPMPAVALPSLGGGFAIACGLNEAGQAAGTSTLPSGAQHAIRIDNGALTAADIESFDGPSGFATGCAIDGDGRVGGQADRAGQLHAFRFTPGASLLDLDTFGSPTSNVESMAGGLSVGWYTAADTSLRAFAYSDADGSFDLNTRIDAPGWVLGMAKAVNVHGVIAGQGTLNHVDAAFLLTPIDSVPDTTPPVIASVAATPSAIFPPQGQAVTVAIAVDASDDSGKAPVCGLQSITAPGAADGDAAITGPFEGTVRAVGGRTYSFTVRCVDAANNAATGSVNVTITPDTTPPVIASVTASPRQVWPPDGRLVPVTLSVSATDDVDAQPSCRLTGITGGGATDDAVITGQFAATLRARGGSTYALTVRCADAAGNASSKAATVTVPPDTTAPDVTSLSASPASIWPANGKFVAVSVAVTASDDVDAAPVCGLSGVSGGPAADSSITGPFSARVRAVRNGDGSVRTYLLEVTCRDRAGNASRAAVTVSVSKDGQQKLYHYQERLRRFVEGLRRRDERRHRR